MIRIMIFNQRSIVLRFFKNDDFQPNEDRLTMLTLIGIMICLLKD